MKNKEIIQMIDEYLAEPHSINKEWVQALLICKQALEENNRQNAEIERLMIENRESDILIDMQDKNMQQQQAIISALQTLNKVERNQAIKEFAERLKKAIAWNFKFGLCEQLYKIIDNLVKELTEKNDKE